MFDPGPCVYMEKLAVGPRAVGAIDITRPIEDNLDAVAKAKGTSVRDLTVVILDRPRHAELIAEVRSTGARIRLITDGDVAGAIATSWPDTGVDLLVGHRRHPRGRDRRRRPQVDGRGDPGPAVAPRRGGAAGRRRRSATTSTPSSPPTTWSRATTASSPPPGSPTASCSRASATTSSGPTPSPWSCGPSRARSGSSTPATRSTSCPSTAPSSSAEPTPSLPVIRSHLARGRSPCSASPRHRRRPTHERRRTGAAGDRRRSGCSHRHRTASHDRQLTRPSLPALRVRAMGCPELRHAAEALADPRSGPTCCRHAVPATRRRPGPR